MQPKPVDWVTERSFCSPANALQRLRTEVEADVEKRNAQRSEKARNYYEFTVVPGYDDSSFTVALIRQEFAASRVTFSRTKTGIEVLDGAAATVILEAIPTFEKTKGECRLMVKGEGHEFWQIRHMALERLFFDTVRTE
jgi:hypothetical protein